QKAVRAAADTFRPNPPLDVSRAITELVVGEALVSLLQGKGEPAPVERTLIAPPCSRLGPISEAERKACIERSPVYGRYDDTVDRDSAYEQLAARAQTTIEGPPPTGARSRIPPSGSPWGEAPQRAPLPQPSPPPQRPRAEPAPRPAPAPREPARPVGRPRDSLIDAMMKSTVRTVGSTIGREIIRGMLGSILKRK
ncbi:MAG: helicase HerA-like domain-containing protein, partial [Reyranellaceae bacterium]